MKPTVTHLKIILSAFMLMISNDVLSQNPFLPLWEYIPDGEPYVFEDPDRPGHQRVYVYGSHDSLITGYCGEEQVVWSAPVEDLHNWRYGGVIFRSTYNAKGEPLHRSGRSDTLYAPDVAVRQEADGTKTYYLYPNNQNGGRQTMVAKSHRPDGPFEVCNWSSEDANRTVGILGFDPAVMVDDDGRVYAYWGFQESMCAELDPLTMATLKPGTAIIHDMIPNRAQDDVFRFFEASSMRKIQDKYVFIYSRWTRNGERGLPDSNYTLAYAYGDSPMGPFTYGGTLIDGRAIATDSHGISYPTAHAGGNTHGSIFEYGGQWWLVYHRQTGTDEYSRQTMVAPISITVEPGHGGKVVISEGEYTSEGFSIDGLNPFSPTAAGIACYYVGPQRATGKWPFFSFSGSYVKPTRQAVEHHEGEPQVRYRYCPLVNNTSGSVVGYKYFNMNHLNPKRHYSLTISMSPSGVAGTIEIFLGAPSEEEGGTSIGKTTIEGTQGSMHKLSIPLSRWQTLKGKQPLFMRFLSDTPNASLCDIYEFQFEEE